MSASREKKTRQGQTGQTADDRSQERQRQQKADRRSSILYAVVGVICVIAIVLTLVLNSGLIQRTAAAVTINDTKYSAVDLQYYYNVMYQNTVQSAMYGLQPNFDYTKDPKDQIYDKETGKTWFDSLIDGAVEYMTTITALYDKAAAESYSLTEDGEAALQQTLTTINNSWVGRYNSRNDMIRSSYGPYMTYDRLVKLLEREALVADYASANSASYTYSDADYDAYYKENKDQLDTFTISQLALRASVSTTDENGDTVEMTEEEKAAALEEAKAEVKAKAEEILAKMEAGEDPAKLAEQYSDDLYSDAVSRVQVGSSVNTSYSEWAFEGARKAGDTTLAEYDGDSSYYYYVVRFEDRQRNDGAASDIRNILVTGDSDAAAKTAAEELLAQWKGGDATEESFAALASSESKDAVSANGGGLVSNLTALTSDAAYIDWALDPARQPGDTAVIQDSEAEGYQVVYFVAHKDPVWQQTADASLRSGDQTEWEKSASEGYESSLGFGVRFVK